MEIYEVFDETNAGVMYTTRLELAEEFERAGGYYNTITI